MSRKKPNKKGQRSFPKSGTKLIYTAYTVVYMSFLYILGKRKEVKNHAEYE